MNEKKREGVFVLIFSLIIILSLSMISVSWFSDFWNSITGRAVEGIEVNEGIVAYYYGDSTGLVFKARGDNYREFSGDINKLRGANEISVSVDVKPLGGGETNIFLAQHQRGRGYFLSLYTNGALVVGLKTQASNAQWYTCSGNGYQSFKTGDFNNVVLTWSNLRLRGYLNGVQFCETPNVQGPLSNDYVDPSTSVNHMYIGGSFFGSPLNAKYFKGEIKDIRIYDRALTNDEIVKISEGDEIVEEPDGIISCTDNGDCPPDRECKSGECVLNTNFCLDSDGGKNYEKKGLVEGFDSSGNRLNVEDNCLSNTLKEYYCNNNVISSVSYTCPNGCVDGACVVDDGEAPECVSDSDCSGGKCENGGCVMDEVPETGENKKDMTKYSDREIFLVSDNDWKEVLSLVSLTTWTQQKGDDSNCVRGYGTPEEVCVYPTLIWHDETDEGYGFDIDSSIYFMQQYQTEDKQEKVTIIGDTPQELDNLLIAESELGAGLSEDKLKRISIEDYLSYWESYKEVVYVEDDYELALMASTYASLLNAPLIIQGSSLDEYSVFENKNIICVGSISGRNCNENYNLEELQQRYVEITTVDKLMLVNPGDLDMEIIEEFQTDKSSNPIRRIYSGASLSSPFLASAKQEILINTLSTDPSDIQNLVKSKKEFYQDELDSKKFQLYLFDYLSKEENPLNIFSENGFSFIKMSSDKIIYRGDNNIYYSYDLSTQQLKSLPFDSINSFDVYKNIFVYYSSNIIGIYYIDDEIEKIISEGSTINFFGVDENVLVYVTGGEIHIYDLITESEIDLIVPSFTIQKFSFTNGKIIFGDSNQFKIYDVDTKIENDLAFSPSYSKIKIFGVNLDASKLIYSVPNRGFLLNYDLNSGTEDFIEIINYPHFDIFFYQNKIAYFDGREFGTYDLNSKEKEKIKGIFCNFRFGDQFLCYKEEGKKVSFLTIFANPNSIPHRIPVDLRFGDDNYFSLDQTKYSDFDSNNEPDLATGRIQGFTLSDTSSYVARDLFYNHFPSNKNTKFLASLPRKFIDQARYYSSIFNLRGYFSKVTIEEEDLFFNNFAPSEWENNFLTSYADHGHLGWAGTFSYDLPNLHNSVNFIDACNTCGQPNPISEGAYKHGDLFCTWMIRKGSLAYVGAVSKTYIIKDEAVRIFIPHTTNDLLGDIFDSITIHYNEDEPLGKIFEKNYQIYTPGSPGGYSSMTNYLGDPTIVFPFIKNE